MSRKPVTSRLLLFLLAAVLLLPVAVCLMVALAALLAAMGDEVGGVVLRYTALAFGLVWVLGLIALVVTQGVQTLVDQTSDSES